MIPRRVHSPSTRFFVGPVAVMHGSEGLAEPNIELEVCVLPEFPFFVLQWFRSRRNKGVQKQGGLKPGTGIGGSYMETALHTDIHL